MIIIIEEYCKGCGICIRFCPKHIFEIAIEVNSRGCYIPYITEKDECTRCCPCELSCPE